MATVRGFRGISYPFRLTPGYTGGILTSTTSPQNNAHIEEALEQIVMTVLGERWMVHTFGAGLALFVGAPMDAALAAGLEVSLREQLVRWESRADFPRVAVLWFQEKALLLVEIAYIVRQTSATGNVRLGFEQKAA